MSDLAPLLARDCWRIVQRYLPNAKRRGDEAFLGDMEGNPGASLKIKLDGPRAASWYDHADTDGGGLLALISKATGRGRRELAEEIVAWLAPVTAPPAAAPRLKLRFAGIAEPAAAFMDARGLTEATARAFRVAGNATAVGFPFYDGDAVVFVKYREIASKRFWVEKGGSMALFGWQAVPASCSTLVITEGEFDAMASYQMGAPALSIPQGAGAGGKLDFLARELPRLQAYDRIVLALDNDQPGRECALELARRLGTCDVRMLQWPDGIKDANQYLLERKTSQPTWGELVEGAVSPTVHPITPLSALARDAARVCAGGGVVAGSEPWPFAELGGMWLRLGTVTVLAGQGGHGKSTLAKQIALGMAKAGLPVLFAPLEYAPAVWASTAVPTLLGRPPKGEEEAFAALNAVGGGMLVLDETRAHLPDDLEPTIGYCARRYGVRHVFIDNLARCGVAEDDYPKQKELVVMLGRLAKEHMLSVVIVAHLRKRSLDDTRRYIGDVKGSGGITDMADSVAFLHRNMKKETDADADSVLEWHKARFDRRLPMLDLWYDDQSDRLLSRSQGGGILS